MKKIIAYIGMVLLAGIACCSLVAGVWMVDQGVYSLSREEMEYNQMSALAKSDAYEFTWQYLLGNEEYVEEACENYNNIDIRVETDKGIYYSDTVFSEEVTAYDFTYAYDNFNLYYTSDNELVFQGELFAEEIAAVEADIEQLRTTYMAKAKSELNAEAEETPETEETVETTETPETTTETLDVYSQEEYADMEEELQGEFLYYLESEGLETLDSWQTLKDMSVKTTVYVDTAYPVMDSYSITDKAIDVAYNMKVMVWVVLGISSILTLALFIYLLVTAGKDKGSKEAVVRGTAKAPWDVMLLIFSTVGCAFTVCLVAGLDYGLGVMLVIQACVGLTGMFAVTALFLMDLVARVRTKTLWKNILIVKIWSKLQLFSRAKKALKWLWKMVDKMFSVIPLIWKWLIIYAGINFFALLACLLYGFGIRFLAWILMNVVVFPIVAYVCIVFGRLRQGSQALADGDMEYKIDDKYMVWEFKDIANNMNSMGEGLEKAVEKQMKSERFKTELISNVSHDIKTPLTSIINYSDLISKEETDNEKIKEYSGILLKQAERLKKLTEDLVDASKASTGNVEVHLAPCELGVLIAQTVGEFEQKLQDSNLEMITRHPEVPVFVMADGKLIWRVFDNLFNNICKYAQPGTRVYLTVELLESKVVVSFKNTSKYALDISSDELLERFVRGDASRHSEGNGLGLSIAKSLVEIQGGTFELLIDGDLFKAVLGFDRI